MSTPPTGPDQPDDATRDDGDVTERLDLAGAAAPEELEAAAERVTEEPGAVDEPATAQQASQPEDTAAAAYPFEEPTTVVPAAGPAGADDAATTVVPAAYPQQLAPEASASCQ